MTKTVTIDITGREIDNVITPLICSDAEDFVMFLATICSLFAQPNVISKSIKQGVDVADLIVHVIRIALHEYLALLIKGEIQPYRVDSEMTALLKKFVEDIKLEMLLMQDGKLKFMERPDGSVAIDLEKMYGSGENTLKGKGVKKK